MILTAVGDGFSATMGIAMRKAMRVFKTIVIIILTLFALFWFLFALLSGASEAGGGLQGLMYNSPNALPWLVLLGLIYLAWRWPLAGGLSIVAMGFAAVPFFNARESIFVFLLIPSPLILLGAALVLIGVASTHARIGYAGK